MRIRKPIVHIAVIAALPAVLVAQDRLKTMPGYSDYQRMAPQIQTAIVSGALAATWVDGGRAIEYGRDGRRYRFDVATRQTSEPAPAPLSLYPPKMTISVPSSIPPARPPIPKASC